jgi:hypothetical protein
MTFILNQGPKEGLKRKAEMKEIHLKGKNQNQKRNLFFMKIKQRKFILRNQIVLQ